MSDPVAAPEPAVASSASTNAQAVKAVVSATGSVKRYRAMAYITGVMLLLLCLEMILRYVFDVRNPVLDVVPIIHGWIYVVYLVTVVDLWSKMRWSFGRLSTMVLGGVVPTLSFFVEKKVYAEAHVKIDAAAAALRRQSAAAPAA